MRPTWNILGLAGWIEQLRVMRSKTFDRLRQLALAWLVAPAPQLITTALVHSGLSSSHHAPFYRLFSGASWDADEMGEALLQALLDCFAPNGDVHRIIDDTLTHHKGPRIDATGSHIDPVRSSKTDKVKAFGHVWVIAAIRLRFPFSPRDFALPIAFRLYRTKADCEATGETFRTKTELAEELMAMVAGWLPNRRLFLSVDNAYFCAQLLKNRPSHVEIVGAMKSNAVLRGQTPDKVTGQTGRPRKQGHRLPSPAELYADDTGHPWQAADISVYRGQRHVRFKSQAAQWYGPNGQALLRVVLVKMESGNEDFRLYASTNDKRDAAQVLELYACRWSLEVTHRELKQELGFGASGVRNPRSVARLPPFVGLLYSVAVAWYATDGCGSQHDWLPMRPWYTNKTAPCFADILAAARHAIRAHRIFPEYGQHDFPRNLTPPWHPYTPHQQERAHGCDDERKHQCHERAA